MLGIGFRILCGLCDSEFDFISLGVILVVLEWLLGCVFGVLSCLWSAWGAIWGSFWGSWGAVGAHFGVWGCPGAPSARNGLQRPVVPFSGAPF